MKAQKYMLIILSILSLVTFLSFDALNIPKQRSFRTNYAIISHKPVLRMTQVEIYTRVGCKYCRIAKAKLDEYHVPYINIDINQPNSLSNTITTRQQERLTFTRTMTVPQIFVGKERIGGCDDLLEEIASQLFFKRLQSYNITIDASAISTTSLENALESSSESSLSETDQAAVEEFIVGEPLNTMKLNLSIMDSLVDVVELSRQLQYSALALVDKFTSKDGKLVNYQRLRRSQDFLHYVTLSAQLAHPSLNTKIAGLAADEKMSLFVNIYNAFIIHTTAILGSPANSPAARADFFSGRSGAIYRIGGYDFSPDDIEHGLIRSNRPHPSTPHRSSFFDLNDPREQYRVPYFDARIHFILNCGARSCPPIQILGENPKEALKLAAAAYLASEIRFDEKESNLYLPKLALWYSADFGADIIQQIMLLISWLPDVSRTKLIDALLAYKRPFESSSNRLRAKEWIQQHPSSVDRQHIIAMSITSKAWETTFVNEEYSSVWLGIVYNSYDWTTNETN
jgi:glutaredoxin